MENHILSSGNNGTLEYKASLAPISPGRYSPIPKHMLVEDDYTRSDAFLFLFAFMAIIMNIDKTLSASLTAYSI